MAEKKRRVVPVVLDAVADTVLAYRPKPKSAKARNRRKRARALTKRRLRRTKSAE